MAAALGVSFCGLALFVDRYGQVERARPADAIVVLGAKVNPGGIATDSLRARTLKAVDLYRRGLAPRIICSGGVGTNPPAEATVAARLAVRHGVPTAALIEENQSRSTWENARFTAAICRERGWTRVIVVSDPYHLWRAGNAFRRLGLETTTSPALAATLNTDLPSRVKMTLRDTVLVVRDLVGLGEGLSR